jgi:phosphohistidine phosphatase
MDLYLMRHGTAEARGTFSGKDDERPLTTEGKKKVRRLARRFRALDITFDCILTSPLLRARQTATLVAKELSIKAVEQVRELSPRSTPVDVLRRLRSARPVPSTLLLVSHEPLLHKTVSFLLAGKESLSIVIKKGGLVKISLPAPVRPGRGSLNLVLSPRVLLSGK